LREQYTEAQVRTLLFVGLVLGGLFSLLGLLLSQRKGLALLGMSCITLAVLAGGSNVAFESPIRRPNFYLSLDWLLLDLVLIATLFISIEKFFRLRPEQVILRDGWQVDLMHYVANHLFLGGLVYLLYLPAQFVQQWLDLARLAENIASLNLWLQVLLIYAITDFTQYWVHRAFHAFPWLWRFHKVHHSVESMDWLAGSRLHVVDILITRSLALIPMVVLGFSNEAINTYLPILALQTVFIHCNLRFSFNGLTPWVATPRFHHWHHTADHDHLDRNFAVCLPIYDRLFGTYHCPEGQWPDAYGLANEKIEGGYWAHLIAPFKRPMKRPVRRSS
ncbi:MAG: sterol desaturase family protein, partial [Salinisphaeraceae bacterium]|nr:sterol desaturase family protein [Salinisphaeraceae bacterium]